MPSMKKEVMGKALSRKFSGHNIPVSETRIQNCSLGRLFVLVYVYVVYICKVILNCGEFTQVKLK